MSETELIRVWPDGTYQSVDEEPYAWMSDDYEVLSATFCDHCGEHFAYCICESEILLKGNMWHILRDGKVIGFATTHTLARAKAGML